MQEIRLDNLQVEQAGHRLEGDEAQMIAQYYCNKCGCFHKNDTKLFDKHMKHSGVAIVDGVFC